MTARNISDYIGWAYASPNVSWTSASPSRTLDEPSKYFEAAQEARQKWPQELKTRRSLDDTYDSYFSAIAHIKASDSKDRKEKANGHFQKAEALFQSLPPYLIADSLISRVREKAKEVLGQE